MADKKPPIEEEEPMLFGSIAAVDDFLQQLAAMKVAITKIEATQRAHDEAIRRMQERVRRLIDKEARNA